MFSNYNQRSNKSYMSYYKEQKPTLTPVKEEPIIVSVPEQPLQEPIDFGNNRIEQDTKMVKKMEITVEEEKEDKLLNHFETLKNKFLNVKNKSLFIKRNKDKIKSLIAEEQKQFINLAKSYFENM